MKGHESGPIIRGKENTIQQILGNTIEEFKLKGVFHVSDTRGGGDYIVGRVAMLESSLTR